MPLAYCLIYHVTGLMYLFLSHDVDTDKNSTQMCLLGFEGNL